MWSILVGGVFYRTLQNFQSTVGHLVRILLLFTKMLLDTLKTYIHDTKGIDNKISSPDSSVKTFRRYASQHVLFANFE